MTREEAGWVWREFAREAGDAWSLDGDEVARFWSDVVAAHATTGRVYHDLGHAAAVATSALAAAGAEHDRFSLGFAAWLHDAVYAPRASDNEARSAALADRLLGGMGVDGARRATVRDLILATRDHAPRTPEQALLADADLEVLGASPERYAEYARAIRREYRWVPGIFYRRGRAAVLRGFLAREHIYHTPDFRVRLESAARANLAAELRSLGR